MLTKKSFHYRCILLILVFCFFSGGASAQSLDGSFSEDSVQGMFRTVFSQDGYRDIAFKGRLLFTSDNNLGSVGFDISEELEGISGLGLRLGGNFYWARTEGHDILSVGIGGLARYIPQENDKVLFQGAVYYSPAILSFLDSERLLETDFRIGYEIITMSIAYIGYRKIWVNIENAGKRTIDEGIHVGLEFEF